MTRHLVFIGGPPAVGKTSVVEGVRDRLGKHAWLDGDSVAQIEPFEVTPAIKSTVESNITHVLRGYLQLGYPRVLLTWVLHRRDLIERLLEAMSGLYERITIVHLVARPDVLAEREGRRAGEVPPARMERLQDRLRAIEKLPYQRIDTSDLSIDAVTTRLLATIERSEREGR